MNVVPILNSVLGKIKDMILILDYNIIKKKYNEIWRNVIKNFFNSLIIILK